MTLVSATAATTASGFTPLTVRRDCNLRPDAVSFGGHPCGPGAGRVGGVRYDGRWRGRRIRGTGYCEYIDRRCEFTRATSPDG